jgi:DNA modification methylase
MAPCVSIHNAFIFGHAWILFVLDPIIQTIMKANNKLKIHYLPISSLKMAEYNPRKHSPEAMASLKESLKRFNVVDPVLVNASPKRRFVLIGGHMRVKAMKEMGMKEVPAVFVKIDDLAKEKELNLRLNKNTGDWDYELLAKFDESFLSDIGFDSESLDDIFGIDETPEVFDLEKELQKLDIKKIEIKKGDVWKLGQHRLKCGDSTVETDILDLMDGNKADLCLTDPPYILNYLKGKKKNGKATEGFGYKRDRRYLETESLPDNFTELWMGNVSKIAKPDFSIIVYEAWQNLRTIWAEIEKHWRVRNMLVWHLPNRNQGFAATRKLFSKFDIAMVGSSAGRKVDLSTEDEMLQNEYETALYAIAGKPTWESYKKGSKYCPTDFIEFNASDEKHSGQGIVFGTKPIEILIPYIKVLTKRDDLIIEPFGGSGSTLIASEKMKRRCYLCEKSPIYASVIMKRFENLTGQKGVRIR